MNTHVNKMVHDDSYRAAYAEESVRVIRADLVSALAAIDLPYKTRDYIEHAIVVADRVLTLDPPDHPEKLLP
jgi:hypothetical protein